MKKFTRICRGLTVLFLILSIGLIVIAPTTIVTHFNGYGRADAQGSRWMLLLEPIVYAVVAEVMIAISKSKRKKAGTSEVNFLIGQEYYWIGALVVILVIFGALMLHQINVL